MLKRQTKPLVGSSAKGLDLYIFMAHLVSNQVSFSNNFITSSLKGIDC